MSRTTAIVGGLAALLVAGAAALVLLGVPGDDAAVDDGPGEPIAGTEGPLDEQAPDRRGEPVPEQDFEMFDGTTASMADYEGQPVVVNFWASWCPPCVAEMPDLETIHGEFADEVAFLGINTQDSPGAAADLVEQTGVTYDLARDPDGELFQAFGVFGMPTTFFVSADGEIVERHTGIMTLDQMRDFVEDGISP